MIIKKIYRSIYWSFSSIKREWQRQSNLKEYYADLYAFISKSGLDIKEIEEKPFLDDKTAETGFDRHYIYHTAWAARKVAKLSPTKHVDISSKLYFSTILSAFVPTEFYDYRPSKIELSNLLTGRVNILELPFPDDSLLSLSCMHVVEHIGLGRYGDDIDPGADVRAMKELQRVLSPGGQLLFVVPVGLPKVVFNAHRVYGCDYIVDAFDQLNLEEFTLIQEMSSEGYVENSSFAMAGKERYGCGCFLFRKNESS